MAVRGRTVNPGAGCVALWRPVPANSVSRSCSSVNAHSNIKRVTGGSLRLRSFGYTGPRNEPCSRERRPQHSRVMNSVLSGRKMWVVLQFCGVGNSVTGHLPIMGNLPPSDRLQVTPTQRSVAFRQRPPRLYPPSMCAATPATPGGRSLRSACHPAVL